MNISGSASLLVQRGFSRLKHWFLNYLHSGQSGEAPTAVVYVNAISLIGAANIFASILIEYSIGNDSMARFMAAITLLAISNVILLRKTQNASLAATIVLLIMLVMLTAMIIDGMFQNTAPIWCATFPALAFFFKGKYKGLLWLGALLGMMLMLITLQSFNVMHTPYSNSALALVMASTMTVGMMVYIYESMRAKAEASLHQAREELHYLAHNDTLTGLPNRMAFYACLPQMLEQANREDSRLAVLFIDLDDFKPINDTFGHEAGDELLRQAGERLRTHLRGNDFVARFGGDEFVAVVPGIGGNRDVGVVADKIIDALSVPFTIQGYCCKIGVSIGIGLYPDCADSLDGLVQLADHAMYAAKQGGKNSYSLCPVGRDESSGSYKGQIICNRTCFAGRQTMD